MMVDGCGFKVVGGVHPVVASQQLSTFIKNDCILDVHPQWIVTGPNMGGRGSYIT